MKLLDNTTSLCPVCLKEIAAKVVSSKGVVYLEKECSEHGRFKAKHVWDDEKIYKFIRSLPIKDKKSAEILTLNLTSRCNQSCPYCYANANDSRYSFDMDKRKIKRMLDAFDKKFKGSTVFLSGGEPTVRQDLFSIVRYISSRGYRVGIFTNGKKLTDEHYVKKLKDSGVSQIILQFDTFNDKLYKELRGEPLLDKKMKVIANLKKYNLHTFIFTMLVKGKNLSEIKQMMQFAAKNNDIVKVMGFSHVWKTGRAGKYKETTTCSVVREFIKQTGISLDEIFDSTTFGFYFFKILQKLKGKEATVEPSCELRCYVHFDGLNGLEPITLSKILDLAAINPILKKIGNTENKIIMLGKLIIHVPQLTYALIKSLKNKFAREILANTIKAALSITKSRMYTPISSILIVTVPSAEDIDLKLARNCNFLSDMPESDDINSLCIRQMFYNKFFRQQQ